MTVVAIWYEPADDALWCVADTRITRRGATGGVVTQTDSGAKIFVLPISCREPSGEVFEPHPYWSGTLGFAFAGDVLPAVMTVATATNMLQNLVSVGPLQPPALIDIAELVRKLAQRYCRETFHTNRENSGLFDASVFGMCPHHKMFMACHLEARRDDQTVHVSSRQGSIDGDEPIVALGSGRERVIAKIQEIKAAGKDRFGRSGRVPKLAVEAMLEEDHLDIGGNLSLGIAGSDGFRIYWYSQAASPGSPAAWRSFNGIDLDNEIGAIGPCIVFGRGMT